MIKRKGLRIEGSYQKILNATGKGGPIGPRSALACEYGDYERRLTLETFRKTSGGCRNLRASRRVPELRRPYSGRVCWCSGSHGWGSYVGNGLYFTKVGSHNRDRKSIVPFNQPNDEKSAVSSHHEQYSELSGLSVRWM